MRNFVIIAVVCLIVGIGMTRIKFTQVHQPLATEANADIEAVEIKVVKNRPYPPENEAKINELLRLYKQLEISKRRMSVADGHSLAALIQAQLDLRVELHREGYRGDFEFATRKH